MDARTHATRVTRGAPAVTAQKLKRLLHDGGEIAVLDVREEGMFAKRHMLLACTAPLSQLELRAPLLVPRRSARVVLVDDDDGLAQRAAEVLTRNGYTDVSVLTGGVAAWAAAGYEIYSGVNVPSKAFGEFVEHHYQTPRMEAADIKAKVERGEKIVILDSRPLPEYKKVSIPGGIDCPGAELAYRAHDLIGTPDTLVVVNCAGRTRSIIGAQSLINAGIPHRVVALKNGTMGWHLAGFQVAKDQDLIAPAPTATGLRKARESAARVARRFGVQYIHVAKVAEFAREMDKRTLYVFDVRSPEEYAEGHLHSTVSAPGGQLVQTTDSFAGVRNSRIVLVDDHGVRATMTASWLIQMGWKDVYVVKDALSSGPLLKGPAPVEVLGLMKLRADDTIVPAALAREIDAGSVTVIDLDSKPRYGEGHIPGAWHAIRANLAANLQKIPQSATIVLTSADGIVAQLAAPEVTQLVGAPVKVLSGGTAAWKREGLPLEQGLTHLTDTIDDVWVRAHDRTENREQAMKDYLTWEVDLITQIGRDDDVEFRHFPGLTVADLSCDVLVVGAGNAALCAALSARAAGASVMVLERAPEDERGGNSRFTEGSMRFAFKGRDDILKVVPDLTDDEKAITDFGSYPEDQFFDDIARVTDYRSDPDLAELLVKRSYETVMWLRSMGIRYMPKYGKQAYKVNGRFTFSGGVVLEVWGGGPGLIEALYKLARDRGVTIHFNARALDLIHDDSGVHGARVRIDGKTVDIRSKSVVLACGGFEANSEMRARYLGPGWDLAKVRGSRFNTGDGIRMALDASAMPYGNWSGCHILPTDINTPNYGDITLGDAFQKNSYLFGIMVNSSGQRFFDEGADFRMYTYVKCGLAVMKQPQQLAWQVFDSKTLHLLRDEYRMKQATRLRADTLEALADKMEGIDRGQFLETVHSYNAAVQTSVHFDPNSKDGRSTRGLAINKSNWATTLDQPPFEAFAITAGITFTFGGIKVNTDAQVKDIDDRPIPGLYAAGELVGGLFYTNYPGGSGLMSGSVFGKIAGAAAARARQD